MAKLQGGGWLQVGNAALKQSGIATGDVVRMRADGRGRIVIECAARLAVDTPPSPETSFEDVTTQLEAEPDEQPDLSTLFPDPEPEPAEPPAAEMVELADYRPVIKPKRKRSNMTKVQVETKRSKPGLRRIGIPNTSDRKSTS